MDGSLANYAIFLDTLVSSHRMCKENRVTMDMRMAGGELSTWAGASAFVVSRVVKKVSAATANWSFFLFIVQRNTLIQMNTSRK